MNVVECTIESILKWIEPVMRIANLGLYTGRTTYRREIRIILVHFHYVHSRPPTQRMTSEHQKPSQTLEYVWRNWLSVWQGHWHTWGYMCIAVAG